jgi:hypothetical protein
MFISLFILLLFPAIAFAAPVITSVGSVTNGSSATISGSGFGTKATAKPYLYAPFEGSLNPSDLGTVTAWAATENASYSAGQGVNGTGAAVGSPVDDSHPVTLGIDSSGFNWSDYGQKWYVFRKMKHNFAFSRPNNWKYIRVWPASELYPNFRVAPTATGGSGSYLTEGQNVGGYYTDTTGIGDADVWHEDEIAVQSNSGSTTTDGVLTIYFDGALIVNQTSEVQLKGGAYTTPMTRLYPWHNVFESAGSTNYPLPAGSYVWGDDIYVDNTWQRIMICSGSAWAARGTCEIQIPHTTWSDDSIQFYGNQGAFADGATAYLYVVDSTGAANSSGYAVTFGAGESDTTAPTITAFTMPATASSLTVNVSSFTATDEVGVTGYCINESASAPTAGSCSGSGWAASAQTSYTFGSAGSKTLYAWAKDAAGNVSAAYTGQPCTITLTKQISSCTASASGGVTSNASATGGVTVAGE